MENTAEQIKALVEKLEKANEAYRTHAEESIMTDQEYDQLVDELEILDPNHPFLKKIGFIPENDSRKQKLPITMASMNKVKTVEEIKTWYKSKGIPETTALVLTPKYDGISLCSEEKIIGGKQDDAKKNAKAWTRGNGVEGQFIPEHFVMVNSHKKAINYVGETFKFHSNGEIIMRRDKFANIKANWQSMGLKKEPANPRNFVGGKLNDDEPTVFLKDCDYIRYGVTHPMINDQDKTKQLFFLNVINAVEVPHIVCQLQHLTENFLKDLYLEWGKDYELDGIIIEINDAKLRNSLGRETGSNNPCYARAYKGNNEMVKETIIEKITWQISKQGYLKPVINIKPVELDGATVSNVFGDNAKFINGYQIGEGIKIKVKRSGMIIPRVIAVNHHSKDSTWIDVKENYYPFTEAWLSPTTCEHCGSKIIWNENKVELMCSNHETCDGSSLQRMIAFFETLECDGISDGICEQFYDKGYKTIHDVLNKLTAEIMQSWDGWGESKALNVYNSIKKGTALVPIEKMQHATGFFKGLGSKKLALLKHFTAKPSIEQICEVEGFSEISAKSYLDGIDKFWEFMIGLPIALQTAEQKKAVTSDKFNGWIVVFTGFRSKEMEDTIVAGGGTIGSSVNKKTTHLVMKEKGSGTTKEQKAIDMGVKILNEAELKIYINKQD